jgi:imidazolonepropionase-like amidohydrolase
MSDLYILHNANLITMEDDKVLYNMDLFVANGKIYKIAPHIDISDVPVKDCTGKFLMPGLFDCHAHMDSDDITEMLIAYGVTTCRNMWGFPETQQWRREIDAGIRPGPHVYSTGPLTDGVTYWEGSKIVTTPEEGHRAVLECIQGGYEYVKTYPSIPREAFLEIMRTANELGIKVMGHGNYNVSFKELADLGYYSIEHISCLPDTKHEEDIIYLAESGMWSCPTVEVALTIENFVHQNGDLSQVPGFGDMNPYWRNDWYKVTEWRKSLHRYDNYDFMEEIERERIFIKHSDKILLGTDVPNPGVTGGLSVYNELEHLVKYFGFTPYQALKCGTVNGAQSLGIAHKTGKLCEGMDADILVMTKNPLENVSNARSFVAVIKDGCYYDKAWCDDLLARVRNRTADEIIALM